MAPYEPDETDLALLTLLEENARYNATDLAAKIGVSDNTVHNRMRRLEEAGVVTGYTTFVDHDAVGLDLFFLFTCTTRISTRSEVAREALEVPEVIEVTELMTGNRNLHIKAIGAKDKDITRIAERLDQLELEINDENLIRAEHNKSVDYSALPQFASDS